MELFRVKWDWKGDSTSAERELVISSLRAVSTRRSTVPRCYVGD
jgi:hypothetical protein